VEGGLKYFHSFSNILYKKTLFLPWFPNTHTHIQTQTRGYITLSKIELHAELVWTLPKSNKLYKHSESADSSAGACLAQAKRDEW